MHMHKFAVLALGALLLTAPAAFAGGHSHHGPNAANIKKDRDLTRAFHKGRAFSHLCNDRNRKNPDRESVRCRADSSREAGSITIYKFMGHSWVHVNSGDNGR